MPSLFQPVNPCTQSPFPSLRQGHLPLSKSISANSSLYFPMGSKVLAVLVPLLFLGMGEVHSVLYESVVGPLRLHALLDCGDDTRQTPVEGCQVWLSQDGVDGVKGQSLAHGCTQSSASQQV